MTPVPATSRATAGKLPLGAGLIVLATLVGMAIGWQATAGGRAGSTLATASIPPAPLASRDEPPSPEPTPAPEPTPRPEPASEPVEIAAAPAPNAGAGESSALDASRLAEQTELRESAEADPSPSPAPEPPPRPRRVSRPAPKPDDLMPPPAPSRILDGVPAEGDRRMWIRMPGGEAVVARVYGEVDGRTSVLLPDGQIGMTRGEADTDEPFRPAGIDQVREQLTRGGPFAKFQVRQSAHYLVLYQSTPPFAEASSKLLEDLYRNLSEAFRKRNFPVREPEFPLVAIIFRTESDFRAHKKVDPDVQAYYEILTNRIYFYQKSERDQQAPEVAALRKPQTVAHEGTHQILQNIGIQPRLSDWPLWLIEGLAEYCSPPTMTRKGAAWGGLGLVNPLHMATIHDLDDPAAQYVKGSDRPPIGRDRRKSLVEYLVTKSDLTPTDYALSWALTHYLAQKRGPSFLAYLRSMSQLPPLQKRTPEQQLATFRAAFGSDLAKMDKAIAAYLAKLKYDPLPYYAVLFEQPLGRGTLRRATLVSQSPSMIRQWIDEVTQPDGGPTSWQIFPHPTKSRAQLAAEQWLHNR